MRLPPVLPELRRLEHAIERLWSAAHEVAHGRSEDDRLAAAAAAPPVELPRLADELLEAHAAGRLRAWATTTLAPYVPTRGPWLFERDGQLMCRLDARVLEELVTWTNIFTVGHLAHRLVEMGFPEPDLALREVLSAGTRAKSQHLEVRADQLMALLDARAIAPRARALGVPTSPPPVRVSSSGELEAHLPARALAQLRGVARRLAEAGVSDTPTHEQILEAARRRIGERGGDPSSVRHEDGDLVMTPDAARVLLAPITRRSAEAQVRAAPLPLDGSATAPSHDNQVFLAQLSALTYDRDSLGVPRSTDQMLQIAEAMGLQRPRVIEVEGAFAIVGLYTSPTTASEQPQHHLVVGIRGTNEGRDWLDNLDVVPQRVTLQPGGGGLLPRGFDTHWKRLRPGVEAYWADIAREQRLSAADVGLVLTGHSLGGAAAVSAVVDQLARAPGDGGSLADLPVRQLYTFGEPRSVDSALARSLARAFDDAGIVYRAVVNDADLVPNLPAGPRYHHARPELRVAFDAAGELLAPGQRPASARRAALTDRIEDHDIAYYLGLSRKNPF